MCSKCPSPILRFKKDYRFWVNAVCFTFTGIYRVYTVLLANCTNRARPYRIRVDRWKNGQKKVFGKKIDFSSVKCPHPYDIFGFAFRRDSSVRDVRQSFTADQTREPFSPFAFMPRVLDVFALPFLNSQVRFFFALGLEPLFGYVAQGWTRPRERWKVFARAYRVVEETFKPVL